jgi:hypothetical protein
MRKLILFLIPFFMTTIIKCNKDNGVESQPKETNATGYEVIVYDSTKACNGTTLFTDSHDGENLKAVEVDMNGEIIWEYTIPQSMIKGNIVGFDVELLNNGNMLLVISRSGLYEISRDGSIVWQRTDPNCSHDADRLSNGNTIYVFGNEDSLDTPCVKEVNDQNQLVWSWLAKDYYNNSPYTDQYRNGWTHANAVTRLENGNTLINLRNFNMTIIVDTLGTPVWELDWEDLYVTNDPFKSDPHDPEVHPDNTLLCCLQRETPYQVVEIDLTTQRPKWEYHRDNFRTCRDADRLPNGNILVVGVMNDDDESVIFEVNQNKEIVWELRLRNAPVGTRPGHFFKAQRIVQ